jgi:hypothetical protein
MKHALLVVGIGALAFAPNTGRASLLCQKRSGAVFVRDACKRKEKPLALAELGAVGPKGDKGEPGNAGAQGPAGVLNAFGTYAVISGPSDDPSLPGLPSRRTLAQLDLPAGSFVIEAVGELLGTIQTSTWFVSSAPWRLAARDASSSSTVPPERAAW